MKLGTTTRGLTLAMALMLPGFQGCTKIGFQGISSQKKLATLQGGAILASNNGEDTGSGEPTSAPEAKIKSSVHRFCSTGIGSGEWLATSQKLTLRIQTSNPRFLASGASNPGQVYCEDTSTSDIKADVAKGYLSFDRCLSQQTSSLAENGGYSGHLYGVVTNQNGTVLNDAVFLTAYQGKINSVIGGGQRLLYFMNAASCQGGSQSGGNGEPGSGDCTPAPNCDENSSPLFVDMRDLYQETGSFKLSAPSQGVLFDLLGQNSEPIAHTPVRISWFTTEGMGLIALPDANGEVRGIDQLFGDNTLGPDGEFASHGYAALAKHDANGDGVITEADPVFSELRLWFDEDHDGSANPNELVSLDDAGLIAIDLNFDGNFSERDQHGNEIKYKSVVQLKDGSLRLMFDVWFKYSR